MTKAYSDDEWFNAFNIDKAMQLDILQYLNDYK